MKRQIRAAINIASICFAFLYLTPGLANTSYVKQWDGAVLVGSFANTQYRYYLEPQIRFIDSRYIYNQTLILGGLGYQIKPDLLFFVGPGWIVSKSPQGEISHEIRLWQQLSWRAVRNGLFFLDSRTRLEERKNTQYPTMAYRIRQRLWLHIPLAQFPNYSFSCFDEIFFAFNHPAWVSPYFFEQNRIFIGVGHQVTKTMSMDVGYLNQYTHSKQDQLDHVLSVIVSVTS